MDGVGRAFLVGPVVVVVTACSYAPDPAIPPGIDGPDIDAPVGPDCLGAACMRRTITIHRTEVTGGPHLAFPTLIDLTDEDLANTAPGGLDIVFTTADGATELPHERELLQGNRLVAWVRVPSIAADADTTIRLYFGDPAATVDHQDRAAVWDAGFQAVWHLDQTVLAAGKIRDSTSHANAGLPENGLALGAPGQIGGAIGFAGDDDRLHVLQDASLDSTATLGTLELWVEWANPANGDFQRLLMQSNTFAGDSTGFEWAVQSGGDYYYYPSDAGGQNDNLVTAPFTAGVWHHVAVSQEFATKTVVMYVDGAAVTPVQINIPTEWVTLASPGDWFWGGSGSRSLFAGTLDEIRVSNVIRDPGWIATEYRNQLDPSTFYAVTSP